VHPHKPPGSKHLAPLLVSTSTLVHQGCTGASEPSFPAPSSLTSQIQDNTSHPITPAQTLPPWHKRLAPRASQLRRQQPHQTTQVKHSNQADHHTKAPIFRADHASYPASRGGSEIQESQLTKEECRASAGFLAAAGIGGLPPPPPPRGSCSSITDQIG
jgi:hypothetical protein